MMDHDEKVQHALGLLQKAFPAAKAPRRQKLFRKKRRKVAIFAKADRATEAPVAMPVPEAVRRLDHALVLGNLTGTDAHAIQQSITVRGSVPDDVAAFLRGIS